MNIRKKIKRWYRGETRTFVRTGRPDYTIVIRHWTSSIAHFLVACCVDHWKWTLVSGLVVAVVVYAVYTP